MCYLSGSPVLWTGATSLVIAVTELQRPVFHTAQYKHCLYSLMLVAKYLNMQVLRKIKLISDKNLFCQLPRSVWKVFGRVFNANDFQCCIVLNLEDVSHPIMVQSSKFISMRFCPRWSIWAALRVQPNTFCSLILTVSVESNFTKFNIDVISILGMLVWWS